MCGIAGWLSPNPIEAHDEARLRGMVDAIAHRGPDGQGLVMRDHAALGHARLAIIDPQGGAQPMSRESVDIVFNGEIYNYRELRLGLEQDGVSFQTHSDTEVVLALYRTRGPKSFASLRGMYAFVMWDAEVRCAWLARDPLGIKPLFYTQKDDDALFFASEAKAILVGTKRRGELDEAALHLLLNFRYLPGDRSLFHGIRQLPPGTLLCWAPGTSIRSETIPIPAPEGDPPLVETLRDSVQAHCVSDVPVGAYLSGGIDSALITALAPRRLQTFTLEVGDDLAEADNAERSAQLLGVVNRRHQISDSPSLLLPSLIRQLELPKVNALQVALLARMAATEVKVVLSGLGGDELFYGYNAHHIMHRAAILVKYLPGPITRIIGSKGADLLATLQRVSWTESQRALLMLASLGQWPRVYGLLRNLWDQPALRRKIYGPRMLDAGLPDAFETLELLWPDEPDPVNAMACFEWRQKMVNDLLWQEDRVSMAVGLEVRTPFVDRVLSSQVHALSRDRLMPNGRLKGELRVLSADVLPQEILNRPKSGFQVDAPRFFQRYLNRLADEYLSPESLRETGLFNPAFVAEIRAQRQRRGLRWHYFMLYLMLGTQIWIREFEQGKLQS